MPHTLAEAAGWAVYFIVCGLALGLGETAERLVAAALLADLPLTLLLEARRHLYDPQYRLLALDILLFLFLAVVAARSNKRWTLFAAAYALLDVLTHLGKIIDTTLLGWGYETTLVLWGYAELAALLVGTLQVVARKRAQAV